VPVGLVRDSAIVYLEGYLWDPQDAKAAFLKAAGLAHEADRVVALSLSDAFCVDRFRVEFLNLIRSRTVDLTFANEAEVKSLYQTAEFDSAIAALREDAALAVVTRSAKGCVIITREETHAVAAAPIARFVDATGAGDLFAAGFLFGLARGLELPVAGAIGTLCAAEIIQHLGARPEGSLRTLAEQNGYAV
jgi:sugar/nucleoside kinase (ribokinase family)